ncbi:MAG TPA: NADH-quinone oxidoreductase subunit N [Bdellovibrionota bacterium]|jgi:NADH-quinone oxidoreductase subunit N
MPTLSTINPANLVLSPAAWMALAPYGIVTAGVLLSMLLATVKFGERGSRLPLFLFSIAAMVAAGVWTGTHWVREPVQIFGGMMVADYFSSFFNVLLCGATALVMLGSYSYLDEGEIHYSEFYPILMSATLGMMLLACATELLTIFVALELMSLTVYVLVGMRRKNAFSNEASIKYFVMGGAAAAVYLYGTALIYGALNTTRLNNILYTLGHEPTVLTNPVLVAGVVLLMVGFLFKVAAAPFHMWTPDVYEGAPANVTSYMATALKAAVFAALVRVSVSFFGDQGVSLLGGLQNVAHAVLWWLALLTMLIGNFVALMQTNLKRLMAYSAIAHTGYLLVGLLAGPQVGYSGIVFYLVAYVAMNIGAFVLLTLFPGKDDEGLEISALAGLGKRHPLAAAALTVFLLSLGGFPPTAGFVGKYYLFSGALAAGETTLVFIAVLTSAVSVYYYLRLVVLMYMQDGKELAPFRPSYFAYAAIAICLVLTIQYGIFPGSLIHAVKKAAIF